MSLASSRIVLFILLILSWCPVVSSAEVPSSSVDVVYCEYRPFFFKGGNGEPRGLLVDFWQLWSRKSGIEVKFRMVDSWGETVRLVTNGAADINAAIFYTPERDNHLDFSRPFFDLSAHIFYNRSMKPPEELDDLSAARIGVVVEDYTAQYLEDHQLMATLVPYPDYESLIQGAINSDVDAFVMEEPVAMSYLAKHGGLNTVLKVEKPLYSKGFLAGVKDGNHNLMEKINQGIAAISEQELNSIIQNWTGLPRSFSLKDRKVKVVTSDDHIPYYYMDEQGKMTGMLIDIWRLWAEKTGIKVEFEGVSFSDSLAMVRNGAAEIHGGCFYSQTRDSYLDYAAFLAKSKTHFFFHESVYGIKNLEDLIGFKIGVMAKDFAIEYIRQMLPGAVLAEYDTNAELYAAVKGGEVRAFVGDTLTALFYLANLGILHEWRHHADRPLYGKDFHAAVQQGDTETLKIIKNGMAAISPQEMAAIERRWIGVSDNNTKDTLVVAMPVDQAPFSMLDTEGNPAGMFADLWRLWAEKTGEDVELRGVRREDGVVAVIKGDADIHAGLPQIPKKTESLAFGAPLYEFAVHLFLRNEEPLSSRMTDYIGRTVGVVAETLGEQWLIDGHPSVEKRSFKSAEAMIRAALQGRIQAFIAAPLTMQPMLSKLGWLSSFRYARTPLFVQEIAPAVSESNVELISRIETGFDRISHKERLDIESRWIIDPANRYYHNDNGKIYLTKAERQWLRDHTVRIGTDPYRAPFEFIDERGEYLGMVSDYMKILEQRLGVKVDRVEGLSWPEVLSTVSSAKKQIDMVPCIVPTKKRKQDLQFSSPYLSFPWVLITRKQATLIGSIRDLYGKTVSVVRDYAIHEHLLRDHPQINLYLANSVEDGLKVVATGEIDAYAGNLATATYQIEKNNFTTLNVAASTPYGNEQFAFGVRSDWPELVGILNKGIQSLSQREHDEIRRKWFSVSFNPGLERAYVIRRALQIGVVILLIFTVVLLWNIQIRRREEWFRSLTEHGSDIILSFREDGTITYQSPSHEQILGYDRHELLGKPVHDLVYKDDLAQWRKILEQLRGNGSANTFTLRFREQRGEYRSFEFHCVNLLDNTALRGFVLNGRDLTERIQVEADLQQAKEEAETASKVKSEFLASMSHEIRTPLNSILGMTDITLRSPLQPEQKGHLRIIKDAARHLLEIINDILDLSKIEAGKVRIQAFDFDLIELLEAITRTYRDEAVKKGLTLQLHHDGDLPRWINGDPLRLRQILINLIGNALKYTDSGKVSVDVHLVKSVLTDAGAESGLPIRFEVKDTGVGIASEKISSIFESFSQGHGPMETSNSGTGLGLAICKKYVDLMSGSIWVNSQTGVGSLFAFQITFGRATNSSKHKNHPKNESRKTKNAAVAAFPISILLAEDSADNAYVAHKFLESMGHHAVTVGDGLQVVETLATQNFDLVLMDLQMPLLNGLDAAAMIRRGEAGEAKRNIPIVAMTAHVLDEYRDQCTQVGMNGFLPKPVEPAALADIIDLVTAHPAKQPSMKPSLEENQGEGKSAILDRERALEMLGGDHTLLQEVFDIFLQETPPVVEGLKAAADTDDCQTAFVKAHTLKGSCARIGALSSVESAGRMQKFAEQGDVTSLRSELTIFQNEFRQVVTLLEERGANGMHTG